MNSALVVLAVMGLVACSYAQLIAMPIGLRMEDDGSWKPHMDGSVLGSGHIKWLGADLEDGSYKPSLDAETGLIYRRRRNVPDVPADAPEVAIAKENLRIQQKTEATRNMLGGIPLSLPADTPEVAAGKQAHAIAHETARAMKTMMPISMISPIAPMASNMMMISPMTSRMMMMSPYSDMMISHGALISL